MAQVCLRDHTNPDYGDFRFGSKNPCSVHVHLVEACNLMAADPNGFSDPYFVLACKGAEERKTKTQRHSATLDPVLNQQFSLHFKNSSNLSNETLKIKVYDYDRGLVDDQLGKIIIPLHDLRTMGIISGWFYLLSSKPQKNGEQPKRAQGRVYVRIIGDKYCVPYQKADPTRFIMRRTQLLDLVRAVEADFDAQLHQRITFELQQKLKEQQKAKQKLARGGNPENNDEAPPPPPPPALLPDHPAYAKIHYDEDFPSAQISLSPFRSTSPCFICSSLQHPDLPAIPISYVSTTPLTELPRPSVQDDATSATIFQDDLISPCIAYKLKLCCATWNVGNSPLPDPHHLKPWLRGDCDIYVIGTQENDYSPRKPHKSHKDDFNAAVLACLGDQYILLQQQDLGQIHIHLIVKRSVSCYIDVFQPKKPTEATGFFGALPNKGGASIAISVLGTTYAFVSSHLAAHTTKHEKRDDDMKKIVAGIQYTGHYSNTSILNSFVHTFWMGDLNYRLLYAGSGTQPEPEKFEEMVKLINNQQYEEILTTDQLHDTVVNKNAFVGFNDAPVNFAPTFKVKKGAFQTYDPLRAPSYTDRVLYRSQVGFEKQIRFVDFEAGTSILTSDHKPVSAVFNIYPSFPSCGISPLISEVKFRMRTIVCKNLPPAQDLNGLADPYIRFSSPALQESVKTTIKKDTLSPVWGESDLPTLNFKITSEGRLWESLVNIVVLDDNPFRPPSRLATGVLSFKSDDIVQLLHHTTGGVNQASMHLHSKLLDVDESIPPSPSIARQGTTPVPLTRTIGASTTPSSSSSSSPSPGSTTSFFEKSKYKYLNIGGHPALEIHRTVQLFTFNGQEAGTLDLVGYLEWNQLDKIPQHKPPQVTSRSLAK